MEVRKYSNRKNFLFPLLLLLILTFLLAVIVLLPVQWLLVLSLGILVLEIIILIPQQTLFFFLITKPLIDLSWRWRFVEIAGQGVNLQTIVALFVIFLSILVFLRRKNIVFDVKGFTLLAVASFSVLISPTSEGFNELIRLYSSVSYLFVASVFLSRESSFNRFAVYYLLSVSVPVFLSLLQLTGKLPFEYWDYISGEMVGRVSGTYQHPLNILYLLVYAFPLSLYFLSYLRLSWQSRAALLAFIAFSLLVVIFTYHRVALIAICLQLWIWMILTKKYGRAAFFVVVGCIVAILARDRLLVMYQNLLDVLQGEISFSSGAFLRGRGMNWYLFLNSLFSSYPWFWLFGLGGSVAEGWVPDFGYWVSQEPHNDFIRILHAYGLLGVIIYISILFTLFQKAWFIRKSNSTFNQGLGNIMILVLIAIVLLSITTEPMRYPTAVWYLFALGSVVQKKYSEVRKEMNRV